jgi:hypothetical protein
MKKVVAPVELESNPSATNTQSSKQSQKEPDVEPSLPRNAKTQLLEQRRRRLLPPELMEILVPSFKVGAATGKFPSQTDAYISQGVGSEFYHI